MLEVFPVLIQKEICDLILDEETAIDIKESLMTNKPLYFSTEEYQFVINNMEDFDRIYNECKIKSRLFKLENLSKKTRKVQKISTFLKYLLPLKK